MTTQKAAPIDLSDAQIQELVDEGLLILSAANMGAERFVVICVTLYGCHAWQRRGLASWEAFLHATGLDQMGPRLTREEKRAIHIGLAEAGLSTRAIAATTGMGYVTVYRDGSPSVVSDETTETVRTLDGKVRNRRQPRVPQSAKQHSDDPVIEQCVAEHLGVSRNEVVRITGIDKSYVTKWAQAVGHHWPAEGPPPEAVAKGGRSRRKRGEPAPPKIPANTRRWFVEKVTTFASTAQALAEADPIMFQHPDDALRQAMADLRPYLRFLADEALANLDSIDIGDAAPSPGMNIESLMLIRERHGRPWPQWALDMKTT